MRPFVAFRADGEPMPQGSKTAQIKGRRIKVGGKVAVIEPVAFMVELANMQTKKRKSNALKAWRTRVQRAAAQAMERQDLRELDETVELELLFTLSRPPSHFTKASGRLTKSAPDKPGGVPDLSKLVRAVEDALKSVVYRDDSLVTGYRFVRKEYDDERPAGVLVSVWKA